jgi:multidrug resistance efflux pump
MARINKFTSSKRGKVILTVAIVVIIIILGGATYMGYQGARYVTTDNARIAAPLINVTTQSACQVVSLNVDVGSYVKQGQSVAEVGQPRPFDASNRQGSKATPSGIASVEAPVSGYVAAVWTYPGGIISPGQSIITIYDSSNVWVSANIDETKLSMIKPGQPVEIKVDSLKGAILKGTVEGIAPAAAATFSLLPQQNTSANFIKVVQVVPVKISVSNNGQTLLIPGTSVEVKIDTQE